MTVTDGKTESDKFTIHRFHHMEFWCQDATTAYKRFQNGIGMTLVGKSDHSTGNKTCASYVLKSHAMVFTFTAPYAPETDSADSINPIPGYSSEKAFDFICKHGLAVRSVGVLVGDAAEAYHTAMAGGAEGVLEPTTLTDKESGKTQVVSEVRAYGPGEGDAVFRFVSGEFRGPYLAGYEALTDQPEITYGVRRIDHIVGNVPDMKKTCEYLKSIMGMHRFAGFTTEDVGTENSGLNSTVMANNNEMVLIPVNEPTHGTPQKSQIQTYLEQNCGAGVQHVALKSDNIFLTLREMKARSEWGGFEFVPHPGENYYKIVPEEWKAMLTEEEFAFCKELGILIDKEMGGLLLQIFTKPLGDRPTIFFEIIQRIGCDEVEMIDEFGNKIVEQPGACGGFGKGNFGELFRRLEEYERQLGISTVQQ